MRLYHTILILSTLIISINAAFQAAWLHQFGQVRATVEDFGKNWLPTVRLTGELARLTSEFRRLELRYVIAGSEAEMASLARGMSKQAARIGQAEERLEALLRSPAEKSAFADYMQQKHSYVRENRAVLGQMMAGERVDAVALARSSGQFFTTMAHDLQAIERINHDFGQEAEREAGRRYRAVLHAMIAAGAASIAVGIVASILAARRISRPLSQLAKYMAYQEKVPQGADLPPPPRFATREVSTLYRAFRALTLKLARSIEKLEAASVTDQLTGVANRRRLMEEGAKNLDICRRGGRECSALMLDLDHFKAVNDTHGHAAGDAVLRAVAETLSSIVRTSDLLARYGGEEFALVAPNSGLEEAARLGERLRKGVEERIIATTGGEIRVTVSIGVAADAGGPDGLEKLLDQADQALYRAKQNGRNRVEAA